MKMLHSDYSDSTGPIMYICILYRLVSYEFVHESTNRREWMKVIISSQYLYFFQESPPDPSTLHNRINLDDLAECRAALGKTSK